MLKLALSQRTAAAPAPRASPAPLPRPAQFIQLGFLAPGTDLTPIVPALASIWSDARTRSMANFNFRSVTSAFNALVYQYPIRIPERFSLVIRSLLTQEGICMSLDPEFRFLSVAYPYVAKRLLTDTDGLRDRLLQVLYSKGVFNLRRLENLVTLAGSAGGPGTLDLSDTVVDGARIVLSNADLRTKLVAALTADNRLATEEARARLQKGRGQRRAQRPKKRSAPRCPAHRPPPRLRPSRRRCRRLGDYSPTSCWPSWRTTCRPRCEPRCWGGRSACWQRSGAVLVTRARSLSPGRVVE